MDEWLFSPRKPGEMIHFLNQFLSTLQGNQHIQGTFEKMILLVLGWDMLVVFGG